MIEFKDYPYYLVSWEVKSTDNCIMSGDSARVKDYVDAANLADEHTWRSTDSYSIANVYYCTEDGNLIAVKIHIGTKTAFN